MAPLRTVYTPAPPLVPSHWVGLKVIPHRLFVIDPYEADVPHPAGRVESVEPKNDIKTRGPFLKVRMPDNRVFMRYGDEVTVVVAQGGGA